MELVLCLIIYPSKQFPFVPFYYIVTYINRHISRLRFLLQSDIINYQNINVLFFHNRQDINYIINVYLDNNQTALHVLQNNIRNIRNTIVITGNFNIRDYNWNPNYLHYSTHIEVLNLVADSLKLELFLFSNPGPTKYTDNPRDTNSVLDLVFLPSDNSGFGKYIFFLDKRKPSNHISIAIEVGMKNKDIDVVI